MEARLVAGTLYSWPAATAELGASGEWLVASHGELAETLPLGVSKSAEWGNEPAMSSVTLHEALERIREVAIFDEAQAADRLAAICREVPAPLLCRAHGLPLRHPSDDTTQPRKRNCPVPMHEGSWALRVRDVTTMVTGLDGVRSLAYHLVTQRKPASRRMAENAMAWPVLPEHYRERVMSEVERDGELRLPRARKLVTVTLDRAIKDSVLVLGFEWTKHMRPQLVLHANTELAAYMADFARHVTDATTDEDVDLSVVCQVCQRPYVPRRQPQPGSEYCDRPECQRARKRRNQAAARERRRAAAEGGER